MPIAHKDIFCTQGIKTTAGSKMLDNFISPYDATVVAKGKAAGLVTLGKVNMDEFAMGSTSENSFYGATANPWTLRSCTRWFFRWFCGSGGSGPCTICYRYRYRWFNPSACVFLWFNGSQTNLRTCFTLRHDCLCIIFRSRQVQWHALQKTVHI